MNIQDAIALVTKRVDLTREQAAEAMSCLMSGSATSAQMGGFLIGLRMKGETVDEITGFAETMRQFATKVPATRRPLVDTCGTGGDNSGTFNISTTAAFVVAGAGVGVAKHGNRSATSKCGSADVLEALGVALDLSPERVGRCIDEIGIGFLFARNLHGAMKHVAPVRAELRTRTLFNILGPLANPAAAEGQVMGIFDPALVESIAGVLMRLGVRHAYVVSSHDGMDEISLAGPTVVAEAVDGAVRVYEVRPEDYGLSPAPREALLGGEAAENASILRRVLEGECGPCHDIVVLNAAPAIVAGAGARTIEEGILAAEESLNSGRALAKLETLIQFTRQSSARS
jgi:anthranilate phosphoribosyltransferase